MQIESNTKRITFFFIAECSLSYQKIMQIEGNTKRITFFFIAECSFVFGSESANRGRFLSFIEDKSKIVPHFIFYKR